MDYQAANYDQFRRTMRDGVRGGDTFTFTNPTDLRDAYRYVHGVTSWRYSVENLVLTIVAP